HREAAAGRLRSWGNGPSGKLACELECCDQARRLCSAAGRKRQSRSVIGRGAHERQAERAVDPAMKVDRLDWDQRLVVIHAQNYVEPCPRLLMECGIGGKRSLDVQAF